MGSNPIAAIMKIQVHKTTMSNEQRIELVRILSPFNTYKQLAEMTDSELHLAWIKMCQYEVK